MFLENEASLVDGLAKQITPALSYLGCVFLLKLEWESVDELPGKSLERNQVFRQERLGGPTRWIPKRVEPIHFLEDGDALT